MLPTLRLRKFETRSKWDSLRAENTKVNIKQTVECEGTYGARWKLQFKRPWDTLWWYKSLCLCLWLLLPLIAQMFKANRNFGKVEKKNEKKKLNPCIILQRIPNTSKHLHGSVTNLQSHANDWTDSAAVYNRYKHHCCCRGGVRCSEKGEQIKSRANWDKVCFAGVKSKALVKAFSNYNYQETNQSNAFAIRGWNHTWR